MSVRMYTNHSEHVLQECRHNIYLCDNIYLYGMTVVGKYIQWRNNVLLFQCITVFLAK